MTSADVRRHLINALRADLVGPFDPEHPDTPEVWDMAPSKRYLTGFLVPRGERTDDDEDEHRDPNDEELAEAGDDPAEESQNDPQARRRPVLASSIGLSVLLPPGHGDSVTVCVTYADYKAEPQAQPTDADGKKKRGRPRMHWHRQPRAPLDVRLPLVPNPHHKLAGTGLVLYGTLDHPGDIDGLAPGTRALALFVVNERTPVEDKARRDEGYVFQVQLEVRHEAGLQPRPDLAGRVAADWDDKIMDLQFRDHQSYASGHGVAVELVRENGNVVGARSAWLPAAIVKRVETRDIGGVTVDMERLATLASAADVHAALDGIPAAYGAWLEDEAKRASSLADERHRAVGGHVLFQAQRARDRIKKGIALLAENPDALRAFCIANRAMALAARQRSPKRYEKAAPAWRMFQLAFVLLNLQGIVDPTHDDRLIVELIFFPTGGGKTEAYLGIVAFTLVWRRMVGLARPDRGLGVAVILRYTLRLLTLDQLGRAATLICALEELRRTQRELGDLRFSLGLWVGRSATANTLDEVARQISEYKNGSSTLSPFPLAACPWCRKELAPSSMKVEPNQSKPTHVEVGCTDFGCRFSLRQGGLPVLFVDEQIYRELPSFLIATVDKFAMLPWRGEAGALFGRVHARAGRAFVGPCTPLLGTNKEKPEKLPHGLLPPDLIVQDELHLISGPLGTMVGLYETAIEALATRGAVKPKIIASTATVKRALQQVKALYGRDDMAMFPPPGLDDGESFFAKVDTTANGRLYVGVAAAGRSAKAVLVTVYAALLAAAEKAARADDAAADPYLTLVGYFNNLRELGGMRRLAEDLIRARAASRGDLVPVGVGANPWMANRDVKLPIELTSRESTSAIARAKTLLEKHSGEEGFVHTVLASNMISVGVDIERLGLMVVAGQPKSTSEYIQASSRVGRDDTRPGLVVTCYNLNKPRDRSYYEHFCEYHGAFYRKVEATSVTPFSSPALDRGLAGCMLAMVRHGDPGLTAPDAAMDLDEHRAAAEAAVDAFVTRGRYQEDLGLSDKELRAVAQRVIDRWSTFIAEARVDGAGRHYSPYDRDKPSTSKAMLWTALDERRAHQKGHVTRDRFVAPTSMRDVESTVHLWLRPAGWSSGKGPR